MKLIKPSVELLSITPDAELLIEEAGRLCYKSQEKITEHSHIAFINNIIKSGHLSVLEHASMTFKFTTDRAVTHQLVRHRIASFSQSSQRYCNYSKDKFGNEITFIEPYSYNCWGSIAKAKFINYLTFVENTYMDLIKEGLKAEQARSVLPNCTMTEIITTANIRQWKHIFDIRCKKDAQDDIRMLMIEARNIAKTKFNSEVF